MKDVIFRLFGTGLLFSVLLLIGWVASERMSSDTRATDAETTEPSEVPSENPKISASGSGERSDVYYQAILDRPLFEVTRRPVDPEAPAPEPVEEVEIAPPSPEAPPLPEVSLLGVMSGGSSTRALISIDGGEPVWLSEGEEIGGWTIIRAGNDWLELAAEDNKVRLELFE